MAAFGRVVFRALHHADHARGVGQGLGAFARGRPMLDDGGLVAAVQALVGAAVHQAAHQQDAHPLHARQRRIARRVVAVLREGIEGAALIRDQDRHRRRGIVDRNGQVQEPAAGAVRIGGDVVEKLLDGKAHVVARLERHRGQIQHIGEEALGGALIARPSAEAPGFDDAVSHALPLPALFFRTEALRSNKRAGSL